MNLFFLIAVIISVLFIGCNATTTTTEPQATAPTPTTEPTQPQPSANLTIDKYNQISAGMDLAQVETLLGPGTEISRTEIEGVPTTAIYQWQEGITNLNITMQDDKVISKAQSGLATVNADITLDQFNQIQTGMTLEDVEAIIGPGEEISRTEIPGVPSTFITQWMGPNFSNMNVTFQDGKVFAKTQTGLQ